MSGLYCDGNSHGHSSCPVIFSTGENPAKHRQCMLNGRVQRLLWKLYSVLGCALVCVQSKQLYRLLKVVPTCILYAQNYVLFVALFSPLVVKHPLCFAVVVSRPQLSCRKNISTVFPSFWSISRWKLFETVFYHSPISNHLELIVSQHAK